MGTGLGIIFKDITVTVIFILAIITCFLSFFGKVKYGLYFFILLIPLVNITTKLQQFPLGKDIGNILLIGMTIGWLVSKSLNNEPLFRKSTFNVILILYLFFTYFTLWNGTFYLGLSAPISTLDTRVQNWKNYIIQPILFFLILNNLRNKKDLVKLFIFMCLAMFIMDRSTLIDIRNATSWISREKFHSTFEWLGANEVSAFYATYTFVILGICVYMKKNIWKITLWILIFLNSFCIMFLYSRGAYLSFLTAFTFFGILRKNIFIIIAIVFILVSWQNIMPQQVIQRINYTETEGELDESAGKRLNYWQESIEYFKQSPIIGVGFNTKPFLGSGRDTHNLYIRTLAEQGLIGLIFLITIIALSLKRSFQLYKKAQDKFFKGLGIGFIACIIAVIIGNSFGDRWTYLPLGAYFWVFLAMVERGNLITDQQLADLRIVKTSVTKGSKTNLSHKRIGLIKDNE